MKNELKARRDHNSREQQGSGADAAAEDLYGYRHASGDGGDRHRLAGSSSSSRSLTDHHHHPSSADDSVGPLVSSSSSSSSSRSEGGNGVAELYQAQVGG